jgi:hypothetical protein
MEMEIILRVVFGMALLGQPHQQNQIRVLIHSLEMDFKTKQRVFVHLS